MRGELKGIWPETWREIWSKLAKHSEYGDVVLADIFRELATAPVPPVEPPPPTQFDDEGNPSDPSEIEAIESYKTDLEFYSLRLENYASAVNGQAERSYYRSRFLDFVKAEGDAVIFLEKSFTVIDSYDDDAYRNRYFNLVEAFLIKYSLRYDLRRPFSLHPTLSGVFAKLMHDLRHATAADANLAGLMHDFDESIRDLKNDQSSGRIKTCIQKQMNLLEAITRKYPGVTKNSLGEMCNEVDTWPHATLREAMKKLYGFSSNYPGIRHGTDAKGVLREIEMRDMVAVTVVLAGFAPYLSDQLNADDIYRGAGP